MERKRQEQAANPRVVSANRLAKPPVVSLLEVNPAVANLSFAPKHARKVDLKADLKADRKADMDLPVKRNTAADQVPVRALVPVNTVLHQVPKSHTDVRPNPEAMKTAVHAAALQKDMRTVAQEVVHPKAARIAALAVVLQEAMKVAAGHLVREDMKVAQPADAQPKVLKTVVRADVRQAQAAMKIAHLELELLQATKNGSLVKKAMKSAPPAVVSPASVKVDMIESAHRALAKSAT